MDPATILSVTATCAKLAKTAWDLGEALYTFTRDAKVINKTLSALIEQSRAVRDPCELLAGFLEGVGQDIVAHPAWATTCHGAQLGNTLRVLQRQLTGCEATLESLCKTTEGIRSTDTASAKKAWATFKFNLCKESMLEHRAQLSLHLTALNTSLHILTCNMMYLTRKPEHSPDDLRNEIDALRQQISELESQPNTQSDSMEHSQLLSLARGTVSDGETVYAQSTAGGSELGDPREANSGQQTLVYSWLHRQVFEASQEVLQDGDSTASLPSPDQDVSQDISQDRWNRDTISVILEEPDYDLDLELSMISTLLDGSKTSFDKGNYHDAKLRLQTATAGIRDLPSHARGKYDFFELQYMLSVATFYATERETAQVVLLDFVRQQATSDQQRFCIAHASQLLAEAYVNLGKLDAARSTCANALRIRHRLAGSDQLAKDQCYALAARIETLLGNQARAETLAYNVTSPNLDACTRRYLDLSVSTSFTAEQRYALYNKEAKLFEGYEVDEDTGRLAESPGRAAQKIRSQTKMTPLHLAVMFRDTVYASALIEAGADVNAEASLDSADAPGWYTEDGLTPLICALLVRHKDMVRLLVSKGANLSLPSASKPHAVALLYGMPYELENPPCSIASMFECTKELGWDPSLVLDDTGQTLIHTAASMLGIDLTEVLPSLGARVMRNRSEPVVHLHEPFRPSAGDALQNQAINLQTPLVIRNRAFAPASPPMDRSTQSPHLLDATNQTASELDTALSDKWMDDVLASINRHVDPFNHTVQPAIGRHGSSTSKPVRIAILDSGFDRANWHIRNDVQRIQGFRSFVSGTDPLDLQDKIGHGTHVLGLLLKFATCAEVYVARVAKDKTFCRDNCDSITQAIHHAVAEWKVDIIAMPFSIRGYHEPMRNAISNALSQGTLLFAAASTGGGISGRAFPAKYPGVFCIHSTDGNGNPSLFNPTPDDRDVNYSLLGQSVRSHWPLGIKDHDDDVNILSGTSVATPIAAGLAASLLSFVRQEEQNLPPGNDVLAPWLKDVHSMDEVLKSMVKQKRSQGYDYITPHVLFGRNLSRHDVYNRIKDIKKHMYE